MKTLGLEEALERGLEWRTQDGAAIVHIVSVHGDLNLDHAGKLVVRRNGVFEGRFHPSVEVAAITVAQEALAAGRSRAYSIRPTSEGGAQMGSAGGEVDIFVEVLPSPASIIIVGAGHIAQPLAAMASLLGWSVTVIDDRPDFANAERFPTADTILVKDFVSGLKAAPIDTESLVVLVTRGHVHDASCLRYVLGTEARYIGMIGSKIRIRTVLTNLSAEGFSDDQLDRVFGPIGIDIGSHSPAEIAVAIAAEIIDLDRGGSAPHLQLKRRVS